MFQSPVQRVYYFKGAYAALGRQEGWGSFNPLFKGSTTSMDDLNFKFDLKLRKFQSPVQRVYYFKKA